MCACVCVYTYMYVFKCISLFIYVCIYKCVCIRVNVSVYVCMCSVTPSGGRERPWVILGGGDHFNVRPSFIPIVHMACTRSLFLIKGGLLITFNLFISYSCPGFTSGSGANRIPGVAFLVLGWRTVVVLVNAPGFVFDPKADWIVVSSDISHKAKAPGLETSSSPSGVQTSLNISGSLPLSLTSSANSPMIFESLGSMPCINRRVS